MDEPQLWVEFSLHVAELKDALGMPLQSWFEPMGQSASDPVCGKDGCAECRVAGEHDGDRQQLGTGSGKRMPTVDPG